MFDVRCLILLRLGLRHSAPSVERRRFLPACVGVFDFTQLVRQLHVGPFGARSLPARFAVTLMNKLHHVVEGRSREENFVHAFASHDCSVLMRDGTAAAAKDPDVASAFAQKSDHFREELDVPAVITGNANGAHVFLDRGANNIADRAMITKIDDLMPCRMNSRLIVLIALSWP